MVPPRAPASRLTATVTAAGKDRGFGGAPRSPWKPCWGVARAVAALNTGSSRDSLVLCIRAIQVERKRSGQVVIFRPAEHDHAQHEEKGRHGDEDGHGRGAVYGHVDERLLGLHAVVPGGIKHHTARVEADAYAFHVARHIA